MGTILEVCTCFAQETVVPNSKSMVGIEDNNIDIKNEKKNEDTCSPNNIIDKKNNKNNNKIGKTPEKKIKNSRLDTKLIESNKKILFPKKTIKTNNSVEITWKTKAKDNKK